MKKFTKICLIIAVICLILGTGFTAAAAVKGARLRDLPHIRLGNDWYGWGSVNNWIYGRHQWENDWYRERDDSWDEYQDGFKFRDGSNQITSSEMSGAQQDFEKAYADMDEYWNSTFNVVESQSFTGVRNLDIDASSCGVQLISVIPASEEEKNQIQVNIGGGVGDYRLYMDGDKLHVESRFKKNRAFKNMNMRRIQILIPDGHRFHDMDMEVKGGAVIADQLLTEKLDIDMAAGNIELYNANVIEMDGDINVGAFLYEGAIGHKADVNCNVGSISLNLKGKKTDYDYEISTSLGSVEIDGNEYSGLKGKRFSNAGAEGLLQLSGKIGSIKVTFND